MFPEARAIAEKLESVLPLIHLMNKQCWVFKNFFFLRLDENRGLPQYHCGY